MVRVSVSSVMDYFSVFLGISARTALLHPNRSVP